MNTNMLKTEKGIKLLKNIALIIFIAGALLKIWHHDTPGMVVGAIGLALWFVALVFQQIQRKKSKHL